MLEKPTADWEAEDLQYLIDNRVEEGERLDYKRSMSVGDEEKNCEAAKDVSALANTSGGRLIIGLVECGQKGCDYPVGYLPIADVGQFESRLLDVLHGRCTPFVAPEFRPIAVEGGHCLVLDVPESLAPVMITGKREYTYYHRVHKKSAPMTEREVAERYQRMQGHRDVIDRLITAADPMSKWDIFSGRQSPWLTILCVPAYGAVDLFNPAKFHVADFSQYVSERRSDVAARLPATVPTRFGLESIDGDPRVPEYLLRLHRSGVVEYHHAPVDPYTGVHSAQEVSTNDVRLRLSAGTEGVKILDVFELAANLYREAGYRSALHVRGEYVDFGGWWPDSGQPRHGISQPQPHQLDTTVDRLLQDRFDFVHGLLDRVWQSAGESACDHQFPVDISPT